ncbi:MAG TPA: energy transducer TonB, partial [Marinobacter sp.]|nr:energy transducer TonB [Marinobacter sp.]
PKPEPAPKPEPRPEPEPEPTPEPASEPAPTPAEPAPAADVSEATETSGEEGDASESQDAVPLQTAGNSADVNSYLSKLSRHLARYYDYPRRARRLGQQGTPVIVFEFTRDGKLLEHSLRDSSGHRLLDDAALQMLEQAAPLPAVPPEMRGRTFAYALPVRFSLR